MNCKRDSRRQPKGVQRGVVASILTVVIIVNEDEPCAAKVIIGQGKYLDIVT
jgi:hypothetical protein